jgi:cell division protein FtsI (penicillin-binding protein 3)
VKNIDPRRARWIKFRMGVLCGLLSTGLFSIVASAYNIQVKHGAEWRMIAERQRQKRLKVQPTRGSILDRNGEALAITIDVPSIAINAAELVRNVPEKQQPAIQDAAAAKLATALNLPFPELQAKLKSKRRFAWLKRRLSQDEINAVRAMIDPRKPDAVKGVMIEGEGHRFYPGREALWGLVGYVSGDGSGIDGVERAFDEDLRGRPDEISALRDRKGTVLFGDGLEDERALAGDDVHLTVDLGLQFQVQEDLEAGLRAFEAKSGSAIVIDPNTGEILAMATAPVYNPNDYGDAPIEARRNHAIADRVEPGSTMKIFTIAAALAEGKIKPTEEIYCENGSWTIGGVTIHDTHHEGMLAPASIISKSSNICAAKIGLLLGEQGLYSAFKRFGFGETTGLGLPGEAAGVLRARGRPWYEVEVASASFGQGISVTTLQLGMAMSAIANGGKLMEPRLVRTVTGATGQLVREELPTVRREVVPAFAARMVTEMMTGVVEEGGTGREAHIPGYRVAGKTATAQKADPATGKYDPDKFVASFVGFVPAQKPRFVIAVVVDEPWIAHLGGQVAAPIFRRIAMRALARFGVAPSGEVAKTAVTFPLEDPTPLVYAEAKAMAPEVDLTGPGGSVNAPMTAADSKGAFAPLPASSQTAVAGAQRVIVPDLAGMGARDAAHSLISIGLLPVFDGTGSVTRQEPAPGVLLLQGTAVRVRLSPGS